MAYTSRVNQIATVVDSVYSQAIGNTNLTSADAKGLISMGDVVLSSATNKEQFYNVLMDRVSKVIPMVEHFVSKKRGIYKNAIEFGNAIQMMIFEAGSNSSDRGWLGVNSWQSTTRGTQGSPYDNTVNTTAKQYIFQERAGWEYDDVIPDFQIKTAFTNAEAMASFIGGIYATHRNKLAMDVEACGNLVINTAMAQCYNKANANSGANTGLFRNLLAEYNKNVLGLACTVSDGTISYPTGWVKVANALTDVGFLKYAVEQIQLLVKRFADYTTAFNIEGHPTQSLNPNVEILEAFASACKVGLAQVYHMDVLSLPGYNSISYWQSSKKENAITYGFEATSSIAIQTKFGNTNKSVSGSYIIGFVYDDMAVMQTVEDYRSHSLFNPKDEVLNTYDKCNLAYAILPFKNMVALQLADPTVSSGAVVYHECGDLTVS